jgi:hypothetical protein
MYGRFGIVCGHLVYFFPFWYVWTKKHLATLFQARGSAGAVDRRLLVHVESTISGPGEPGLVRGQRPVAGEASVVVTAYICTSHVYSFTSRTCRPVILFRCCEIKTL